MNCHPRHHALARPDAPAVIFANGPCLTYGILEERANQVARLIRRRGLTQGDVVAMFLENEAAVFEIAWACQRAGLYFVPISSRLLADEVSYILTDSGTKLLFASAGLRQVAQDACYHASIGQPILTGSDYERLRDEELALSIEDEAPGIDMVYSSGTTGRPKGVRPQLPEGGVEAETRMVGNVRTVYGVDASSVYLSPAPLYHAAPLRWSMTVQRLGGTVVVMDRFDARAVLELIEFHRVTHAQFVPTHFVRMLDLPHEVREDFDHSSLKAVIHAAAPCPRAVKEAMFAWLGPILFEYYGGSEGNGTTLATPQDWLAKPGTVGRSLGCEVKICGEDGEPLGQGKVGTVYFAGGPAFEYHNDPEKTRQSRNQYGWSTLGDVGYLDEDGYLFLTDRKNFMIISGGVNIYPQEVEDLILQHPAVADVAVVPAPHADLGEQVAAVIELQTWASADENLAVEIRDFAAQRLSGVKVPRIVDFIDEMPRLPTGKLMKRHIRDAYFKQNDEMRARLRQGYAKR